jgi:8-oxo-dGTP pyrophosphatase MutT (NUDIX family)
VALIRREQDGATLWLAQWNRRWGHYHFVAGHKLPDESFRRCLAREIAEELHLREGTDFHIAAGPPAHVEYTAWSAAARAETSYTMELFAVDLTEAARRAVDENPLNRWLTEAEVRDGRAADGKPVSPTMRLLLSKIGLPKG